MWSLFTLATSGIFPLSLARKPMQMNFPCPLVILRHWRDLETQQERKKKAIAQGLNGGKRSRRTP
jgi:hypothetical protein